MNTAQQLKRDGQQLALFNHGSAWVQSAMECLESFCRSRKFAGRHEFLFEEFREYAESRGLYAASPKVWGSLPRAGVKLGLIESTGQYRATTSAKTHGHPALVWRSL
jgi:hypothetical protein